MNENQVMLQYLRSIESKIDDLHDKLEPRIGEVEKWQNNADGQIKAYSLLTVSGAGIISFLANLIKH